MAEKEKPKMCPHFQKPCLENGCMAWRSLSTTEHRTFYDCVIMCAAENQTTPYKV